MWFRLAVLVALLASGYVWLGKVDPRLPYPAHHHSFLPVNLEWLPLDAAPLNGVYAPNQHLRKAHRLFEGAVRGSEHIAISPGGNLTLLDKYGYLYEAEPANKVPGAVFPDEWALDIPPVAYVGPGRPLGFEYDHDGTLVIADSLKGLLRLDRSTGALELLSNRVSPDAPTQPGSPLTYVNALDIADPRPGQRRGVVYFSASQDVPVGLSVEGDAFYDTFRSFMLGFVGGSVSGRLLRYDPASRRTEVLVSGLWFANGVALSHDESFVAVVETNRLRVLRYWLKGPKAGTTDVLIEHLPGFPDGIHRASDGNFWVALVAPPNKIPHMMKRLITRVLLVNLPPWARPKINIWGAVLKVSPSGTPLQLLMDPEGAHVAFVSSVTEHEGRLYMGNVKQDYVSYIDLRDVPPLQQQQQQQQAEGQQ